MNPPQLGAKTISIIIQPRAWHAVSAQVQVSELRHHVDVAYSPPGMESGMLSGTSWNPYASLFSASPTLPGLLDTLEITKLPKEDAQSHLPLMT